MSAPTLPGPTPGPSSRRPVSAAQRAREVQDALKAIVLQTAATLRSRSQQARLASSVASSTSAAASDISSASASLQPLTSECTRYLSLVHGLRDYLLHAQAALEIELEAATQREAEEAKLAAEALQRQQEAQAEAQKRAAEQAELAESQQPTEDASKAEEKVEPIKDAQQKTEGEADESTGVATPPLPPTAETAVKDEEAKVDVGAGAGAGDAIVIDSDGEDDEDDVPLAFAPKAPTDAAKPIDLTDSPALVNAVKPTTSTVDATSDAVSAPDGSAFSLSAAAPAMGGIDLSALGINLSSLSNLPDLSSLGIPSLGGEAAASGSDAPTALAPATDLSELEKMMGMATNVSGTADAAAGGQDAGSMGGFGLGDDADLFGSGAGGLDLSNFDFSSLTAGTSDTAGADATGGVDLSSFLTNFSAPQADPSGDAKG